jgi:hypothetical protein
MEDESQRPEDRRQRTEHAGKKAEGWRMEEHSTFNI